jgi:hypothetical protein
MKPRDFCLEPGFPLGLALTYSFDPIFFDRIVLRALWGGGTEEILVLADALEIERTLDRTHGPIHHLGRRYLLSPVRTPGSFHPKLWLRIGREGGIVLLATGNLTHGGWGLNRELATAWRIGPHAEDQGGWIPDLLRRAVGWAGSPLAERVLSRMADFEWLREESSGRVLFTGPTSLATQLRRRWAGRRFTHLRFVTGSTDAEGAVLRWLHETFGVETAVGCITPQMCSFSPMRLSALPVSLSLIPHPVPIAHAKAYHLSGPDGDVFLVGSANCSASGWLRSPTDGGNVEAMLVYDPPSQGDLAAFNELFSNSQQAPEEVLIEGVHETDERPGESALELILTTLQIEEDGGIVAGLSSDMRNGWEHRLVIEDQPIPLHRSGAMFVSRAPENLPAGQTAFGYIEAVGPDGRTLRSNRRWIDDLRILHESASARAIAGVLEQLPRPGSRRDDSRLLADLTRLAHDLSHDMRALQDPFIKTQGQQGAGDENRHVSPVDPTVLIRNLSEDAVRLSHPVAGKGMSNMSLSGIFRALFGAGESTDSEHEVSIDEEEAAQTDQDDPVVESTPPGPGAEQLPRVVEVKDRKRFEKHLDRFMADLRASKFRDNATATQLVQAIAYPFAATALGLDRGWTDRDRARTWVLDALKLLLLTHDDGSAPLLEQVRQRYVDDGAADLFERIVGEGTLWVTMIAGIAAIAWPEPDAALRRLLLINTLWRTEVLRARAEPEHIEELIRRYHAGQAVQAIREIAAPAVASLCAVEARLSELVQESLLELQATTRMPVQVGEFLWGPTNGWAVAVEKEKNRKARVFWATRGRNALMSLDHRFASVQQAAAMDEELRGAFARLLAVLETIEKG